MLGIYRPKLSQDCAYRHILCLLNPNTDGGLGQLRTDGGGGERRITAPTEISKISKLDTSSKRHWIRVDEIQDYFTTKVGSLGKKERRSDVTQFGSDLVVFRCDSVSAHVTAEFLLGTAYRSPRCKIQNIHQ